MPYPLFKFLSSFSRPAWAALLACAVATPAHAGVFSVSPVRIFMQLRDRAVAVTINNEGDTELVMQAELFEWTQSQEGKDELKPTDDLILSPPVLKIPPRGRQVVRLANLRPPRPDEQLSYRLIVREIPEAIPPKDNNFQIQVALAFSLPVFITPPQAKRDLQCSVRRDGADKLAAICENKGLSYAQPVSMALTSADGTTLVSTDVQAGYVLPNKKRTFEIPLGDKKLGQGSLKLAITQDDGSKQTFDVLLSD